MQKRIHDFVNLYDTSGHQPQFSDGHDTGSHKVKSESPKRERSYNKRKKDKRSSIEVSQIITNKSGLSNDSVSTPLNESKVTSTPLVNRKQSDKAISVKSIMKNSSSVVADDTMEEFALETSGSKSKKRNKSVSFMLGENEEVVNKKTRSDDSTEDSTNIKVSYKVKHKKEFKKSKKTQVAEKENDMELIQQTTQTENTVNEKLHKKSKSKSEKVKISHAESVPVENQGFKTEEVEKQKKKHKKLEKVQKSDETVDKENITIDNINTEITEKPKKSKKKKHKNKPQLEPENGEPASKSRKSDLKSDVAIELENLSIGDNAHTLTNMLDEMTVADKNKRKKLKHKLNKKNKAATESKTDEHQKIDEAQDKKWMARKWNKENKSNAKETSFETSVIVENIPLSMMLTYKKKLTEHFMKYGLIKSVGIVEVYPTEVSKPVFTTTINFYSDGAAAQALADKTVFEGSQITVKRSLPPTETTVVVRSYAPLTVQSISTMFQGTGRIRNIRSAVKGKHSMSTFFVELHGPKSVESAMKLATDAKIGGKKVYVSKFEVRTKKIKQKENNNNNEGSDADHSADSQD